MRFTVTSGTALVLSMSLAACEPASQRVVAPPDETGRPAAVVYPSPSTGTCSGHGRAWAVGLHLAPALQGVGKMQPITTDCHDMQTGVAHTLEFEYAFGTFVNDPTPIWEHFTVIYRDGSLTNTTLRVRDPGGSATYVASHTFTPTEDMARVILSVSHNDQPAANDGADREGVLHMWRSEPTPRPVISVQRLSSSNEITYQHDAPFWLKKLYRSCNGSAFSLVKLDESPTTTPRIFTDAAPPTGVCRYFVEALFMIGGSGEYPAFTAIGANIDASHNPIQVDTLRSDTVSVTDLAIPLQKLGSLYVGISYGKQLVATGGQAPYQWTSTALPAGLYLGSDGYLGGTPQQTGAFSFTATVTDPAGSVSRGFSGWINPTPPMSVAISGPSTISASESCVYSVSITSAWGGPFNYQWYYVKQSGVVQNRGTDAAILVTPQSGDQTFTLEVTVSGGGETAQATLVVSRSSPNNVCVGDGPAGEPAGM